jgi:hypothetical protein
MTGPAQQLEELAGALEVCDESELSIGTATKALVLCTRAMLERQDRQTRAIEAVGEEMKTATEVLRGLRHHVSDAAVSLERLVQATEGIGTILQTPRTPRPPL